MRGTDRYPRGIFCDGGFRLAGTPLAFFGASHPDLLFCAHLDQPLPRNATRIIGTGFLLSALRGKRHQQDMLAVDYERPFRLGKMELRLLPAGMGPGSAMLEVRLRGKTILYCGGVRLETPLCGEPAALPRCDVLLLDMATSPEKPVSCRVLRRQLIEWLMAQPDTAPACGVLCGSRATTYDVVTILEGLPVDVYAHRTLYDMLRETGYLGAGNAHCMRLGSRWPSSGVVLFPTWGWESSRFSSAVQTRLCVAGAESCGTGTVFGFGQPEHLRGVVTFAKKTGAASVVLSSRCDSAMEEALKRAGLSVCCGHPPIQMPLWE